MNNKYSTLAKYILTLILLILIIRLAIINMNSTISESHSVQDCNQ